METNKKPTTVTVVNKQIIAAIMNEISINKHFSNEKKEILPNVLEIKYEL